jgi:hypothetical protein
MNKLRKMEKYFREEFLAAAEEKDDENNENCNIYN